MQKEMKNDRHLIAILWILFGTLGRLLPHAPNMTPMTSVALFSGSQLGRFLAFTVAFATMIFSDIALGSIEGHQVFGTWTFFTYSGFAAMIFVGSYLRANASLGRTLALLLASSLGFWVWTNFGTWAAEGLYPRTAEGLVTCYVAALPFLRNALAGDLAWGLGLFLSFRAVRQFAPQFGWNVQGAQQ